MREYDLYGPFPIKNMDLHHQELHLKIRTQHHYYLQAI